MKESERDKFMAFVAFNGICMVVGLPGMLHASL